MTSRAASRSRAKWGSIPWWRWALAQTPSPWSGIRSHFQRPRPAISFRRRRSVRITTPSATGSVGRWHPERWAPRWPIPRLGNAERLERTYMGEQCADEQRPPEYPTGLGTSDADQIQLLGHNLATELIGRVGFGELALWL